MLIPWPLTDNLIANASLVSRSQKSTSSIMPVVIQTAFDVGRPANVVLGVAHFLVEVDEVHRTGKGWN